MSWQVVAGVAKPGQRRETRRLRLARGSDVFDDLTGLPHPSGVRGFKSHLPHLEFIVVGRQTYQHLKRHDSFQKLFQYEYPFKEKDSFSRDKTIQMIYKGLFGQWLTVECLNHCYV